MRSPLLAGLLVLLGCGDNQARTDAGARDAGIDAPTVDAMCGADRFVTGELVDLDSTLTAFAGVSGATFTAQQGGASDETSPNGRFELCAPATNPMLFDVDAPGDRLDGIAYIEEDVAQTASLRSLTPARAASFYLEHGLVFDATRAHVLVFVAGDRSELTLDRTHDAALAGNDDTTAGTFVWSAGNVGRYVLFPNVDAAAATGTLTGDTSGPHTIPLQAGRLTLVAASWVFL